MVGRTAAANIWTDRRDGKNSDLGWGIVAYPVIQAIGRPDFEDGLRTRSPGDVFSD